VVVNIPKFSEDINMTAKMIDVEDGSILWMGSGSGTTGRTVSTIVGAAAGAAVGALSTGKDEQVLGGVAGAVLGGVAGRALSPQQAQKAQKIIKKICLTMPSRIAAR
jgi:outer membrane lipoprotein SlyB